MKWTWFLNLLCLLAVGCSEDTELEIEMRSEGDALARTVRETRRGRLPASFDRTAYEEVAPGAVSGHFADEFSGGLGGDGFVRRFESDLGSATLYTERLARRRSAWELVEEIDSAGDRCVDLLLGWLRWQLDDVSEVAALDADFEAGLRNGIKETILFLALPMGQGAPIAPGVPSGVPIVLHELLSSGWLTLGDAPCLARLADLDDDEAEVWLATRCRAWLGALLELAPDDPALEFLADLESMEASWQAWLGTEGVRGMNDPPDLDSGPWNAFEPLIESADLGLALFRDTMQVTVELDVPGEVVATNGELAAGGGAIHWAAEDVAGAGYHPAYRFAVWVEPDEGAQRERFGAVRLDGADLVWYVLWYEGLAPEEESRWRAIAPQVDAASDREQLEAEFVGLNGGLQLMLDALASEPERAGSGPR